MSTLTSGEVTVHRGAAVHPAPTVSVIIPTLGSVTLERAIASVLEQTWEAFELLVIDDGTPEPVAPSESERVVLVRQPNAGPGGARNRGLTLARGRLVAFLDSDDVWRPENLARQVDLHRRRPRCVLSTTDTVLFDAAGELLQHAQQKYRYPGEVVPFEMLFYENCITTSAAMAKRWAVRAAGGFDASRNQAEDFALWLRVAMLGEVGYVNEILTERHDLAAGLSRTGQRSGRWHAAELQVYDEFLAEHARLREMAFVRAGLARAQFDAGYGYLLNERWAEARKAFEASLRLRRMQPRAWLNWVRAVRRLAPAT